MEVQLITEPDYYAPFVTDHFYHVYNRANTNTDKLFFFENNYDYFLQKFNQHLSNYIEVWAYCLIPNHFHFLIRVKDINTQVWDYDLNAIKNIDTHALCNSLNMIKNIDIIALLDSLKVKNIDTQALSKSINAVKNIDTNILSDSINVIKNTQTLSDINVIIEKQFRKFFIGYAQAINKQEARRGSLFQKRFKRIHIDDENYLMNLIHYIHHNPTLHNLTQSIQNWHYSSYNAFLNNVNTKLMKKEVLELFGSQERFIEFHQMLTDYNQKKHYFVDV